MKRTMKALALAMLLPLMAACSTVDIDKVSSMEIKNWPFAKALHQEYVDLAYTEAAEKDWKDANFFGAKASDVAMSDFEIPGPQALGDREIPEEALADLTSAYAALNAALDSGRRTKPQAAARAQAMFDCWMQEQEENFQPDDIAACRKGFDIAMKSLTKKPAPAAAAAAPEAAPEAMPMQSTGPFMVFFAYNSAAIDSAASNLIKTLAGHSYAQDPEGYIVLSGHTDRSGASAYNDALSEMRTVAVYDALMQLGAKAHILNTSYGEDRPADVTEDGMQSAKNRRVEITLSR